MNDVPEMFYVTDNILVCPPLDGLESSEILAFDPEYENLTQSIDFKDQLRVMLPPDEELNCIHSQIIKKVASYMSDKHGANYILYNLFRDRQLDHAANLFH